MMEGRQHGIHERGAARPSVRRMLAACKRENLGVSSRYFVDFTGTHSVDRFGPVDGVGIPLWDPKRFRLKGGPLYHPVVIAQIGLANFDRALDGDQEADDVFLRTARWIEDHGTEDPDGRFLTWPCAFPLRTPPVPAPWISGMGQGQVLSLLTRLYQRTRSPRTEEVARRAARSFCYPIEEGGVVSEMRSGALFIEEVVSEPAIQVLNGCLYGLYGLYEYAEVFEDQEVRDTLARCVQGVEEALPLFDMGWWSRYSLGLRWHVAPFYYHNVHIEQLRHLAVLLDRPQFEEWAQRWDAYRQSKTFRRRRTLVGAVEVNVNRALTIAKLNSIKYRTLPPFAG
jgi:heparosan-N-sulfate-glucuronate 5-epimerase